MVPEPASSLLPSGCRKGHCAGAKSGAGNRLPPSTLNKNDASLGTACAMVRIPAPAATHGVGMRLVGVAPRAMFLRMRGIQGRCLPVK